MVLYARDTRVNESLRAASAPRVRRAVSNGGSDHARAASVAWKLKPRIVQKHANCNSWLHDSKVTGVDSLLIRSVKIRFTRRMSGIIQSL